MSKLIPYKNDLYSQFPFIAKEANGWDPSEVAIGSNTKQSWKCKYGHIWEASTHKRTNRGDGCPYCANKQVWPGFNDLKTKFPEIAKEANGWDPSEVLTGSDKKKKSWKCKLGHIWETTPYKRCHKKYQCPYCSNKKVFSGFNDLKTKFPEIAKEADGWDPSKKLIGNDERLTWKCQLGHTWKTTIRSRVKTNCKCPFCTNRRVWPGFNDLKTKFPEIAKEANGWDPSQTLYGQNKKMSWICKFEHIWEVSPNKRIIRGDGCPYCSNKKVFSGFNDLKTKFPEIAKEANGWDPSKELFGSSKKLSWKCEFGHTWKTKIIARTGFNKTSCPTCSVSGFDPNKIAWLYLMGKKDEQQIGITNVIKKRIQKHKREGWKEIDQIGPYNGQKISEIEKELKLWIKKNIGLVPNKLENWYTKDLKISSLKDLKKISNLKTNLF